MAAASIWAKVGRELRGTGGGAGGGEGFRVPAPKPHSRADLVRKLDGGGGRRRGGRAGDASPGGGATAGELTGLDGRRGGREGLGGSTMRLGGRDGVSAASALASSSRREGGSGGSPICLVWSNVGGSFLGLWASGAPFWAPGLWFSERLDTAESWDTSEAFEFLLTERFWVEGRRVGRFGGVARWPFRVGRGGGAAERPGEGEEGDGTGEWSPFSRPVVRRGSGGGSFSVAARTGRGGMTGLFSAETPPAAALFASPATGRTGGGGGGGRLPAADGGA